MKNNATITKVYYIKNSYELDKVIDIISKPSWCLKVVRELIEMDYSQITVECLPTQICAIEAALAHLV